MLKFGRVARSAQSSAIRPAYGNTILAILHRTGADVDALRRHVFTRGCWNHSGEFRCKLFPEISDRHNPSKLMANQNASTTNADKLNLKMRDTIISSAPPAFSSE